MNNNISVCMITKNEGARLDRCLSSIQKFGFELVIVDTGSTDNTKQIASRYTDNIYDFEWCDDFSAARNYSISLAKNNYILILDSDEIIIDLSIEKILDFITNTPKSIGVLTRNNHYIANNTDTVYVDSVERFFDRRLYNYQGIIHEQVCPISSNAKPQLIPLGILVDHAGYKLSLEEIEQKAARNNALLFKQLELNPNDPYIYFQIGQSYNMCHDDEKANYYYGKGLEYDVDPNLEYVQMMVIEYGYTLLHLNRAEEALFFEGIYEDFNHSADFLVLMGLIYMRNSQYIKAMQEFLKAISTDECHVTGANTFIPRYNIGIINEMMGKKDDAITLYRSCGDFSLAKERLKELMAPE